MTFQEYQKEAVTYRTESANCAEYLELGLIAEVGEVAGKLAKRKRDGVFDKQAFIKELGDVLWFVANIIEQNRLEYITGDSVAFSMKLHARETCKMEEYVNCLLLSLRANLFCESAHLGDGDRAIYQLCKLFFLIDTLAKNYGYTLEQVAEINLKKLRDRKARGVIQGNGDER